MSKKDKKSAASFNFKNKTWPSYDRLNKAVLQMAQAELAEHERDVGRLQDALREQGASGMTFAITKTGSYQQLAGEHALLRVNWRPTDRWRKDTTYYVTGLAVKPLRYGYNLPVREQHYKVKADGTLNIAGAISRLINTEAALAKHQARQDKAAKARADLIERAKRALPDARRPPGLYIEPSPPGRVEITVRYAFYVEPEHAELVAEAWQQMHDRIAQLLPKAD